MTVATDSGQQQMLSVNASYPNREDIGTTTPQETVQVRVLSHYSNSNASPEGFNAVETVVQNESAESKLDPSENQPPVLSKESEGAILIVEDLGRTQYTGLRSNSSFLLCVQDVLHTTSRKRDSGIADRYTSESVPNVQPPLARSEEAVEALKAFPPQEIAAFLVSTFFYHVEATFFYCDREWFYTTLNEVFTGDVPGRAVDDAFICFALLVFAFGSQFAHLRSRAKSQDSLPPDLDPGRRFYDCAQTLVPKIIATCTLKGIQVCLLAGLYNLPYNLPDTAYLYLGMAMRMSIASGLHRKTLATTLDPRMLEVRNRLWWSVYSIDKRTSIALGRPSSIPEDAIDAPFPKYHASLDDLEYQSNVQHQVEYLKLTRIISQIVQNIPLESNPSCVQDLSQELKQWRSQLFSNLHPNDLLPSERNFRTTVHLHIHYHWAWILIGRASLLQISRERIQALSNPAPPIANQPRTRTDLANLCVDAAKATIELILVLKKHNLLCRFSFTDHHATTAALIILILHSILQHGDETSKIIEDGVDMLRYMGRGGCRGASSDLQTIEQLKKLASDLRHKIYQGESSASTGAGMQPTSINNSYEAWVTWMSEQEASNAHLSRVDNSSSQQSPQVINDDSRINLNETSLVTESGSNDSISNALDYRSLDQGNIGWNFDTFGGSIPQQDVLQGFEWDDGRVDILDMTQLLGNFNGQTTYD
ncbi:uncharacterized protein RSE6_10452 [Rhynchosporium secalis]|uniref:Xylanolytic transcriptional activator regulatory domain-containing protein n=1 Tax=Rhynchosporium secalis TaxID=38038 RepID=A0A1E1MKH1_RHYSE|nr:uncharacterized protein RSE6_10452 [Rhynchosporium secalis]